MGSCWKERNLDTAQHPYKTEVTAYIIIRQDSATSTDMGWDTSLVRYVFQVQVTSREKVDWIRRSSPSGQRELDHVSQTVINHLLWNYSSHMCNGATVADNPITFYACTKLESLILVTSRFFDTFYNGIKTLASLGTVFGSSSHIIEDTGYCKTKLIIKTNK